MLRRSGAGRPSILVPRIKNMLNKKKLTYIAVELGHHLPYTIFGVTMGLMLLGILNFLATLMRSEHLMAPAAAEMFHVTHASHILFSAMATTAMFWKHEKRILKAMMVGSLGSIVVCALSDSVFPTIGGKLLGIKMSMHICIIEHPGLILPFATAGVLAGFLVPSVIEKSTQYSHSAHVLFSSVSCILYLIGFGMGEWVHQLGIVFILTVISVMLPCCMSGIVFPLVCVHRDCSHDSPAGKSI